MGRLSPHVLRFETKKNLREAFAIAQKLWFVYESLCQYRLRLACDETRFLAFQKRGKLAESLRGFKKYEPEKAVR